MKDKSCKDQGLWLQRISMSSLWRDYIHTWCSNSNPLSPCLNRQAILSSAWAACSSASQASSRATTRSRTSSGRKTAMSKKHASAERAMGSRKMFWRGIQNSAQVSHCHFTRNKPNRWPWALSARWVEIFCHLSPHDKSPMKIRTKRALKILDVS